MKKTYLKSILLINLYKTKGDCIMLYNIFIVILIGKHNIIYINVFKSNGQFGQRF